MKLKCPGCSKVLQVPDSAAGKVVRCQCGKQLRVPENAAPASRAAVPTAGGASRPRPGTASQGGFGDLDPGLFDELTDVDLRPTTSPGSGSVPAVGGSGRGSLMKQYAPPGEIDDVSGPPGKRPGLLTFLGVINGIWAVLYLLGTLALFGLVAMLPVLGEAAELEEGQGALLAVAVGAMVFATVLSIATAASCFVSHLVCWYVVLFSYAFACGERLITIGGMIQAGQEIPKIIGGGVAFVVGLLFLAFLHGEPVRRFYRAGKLSIGKVIAPDLLGLLFGLGLAYAVNFLE